MHHGAGHTVHAIDLDWWGECFKVSNVFMLVEFYMVMFYSDWQGGFDSLNLVDDITVAVHDVLDGKGGAVMERVKYSLIIHVVMNKGSWKGMAKMTKIANTGV